MDVHLERFSEKKLPCSGVFLIFFKCAPLLLSLASSSSFLYIRASASSRSLLVLICASLEIVKTQEFKWEALN